MGTLVSQEIPEDRILLYCRALNDISEAPLCFAFERGLKSMGEFLPTVQQLRTWSGEWKRPEEEKKTQEIMDRDVKPPDWYNVGKRIGVSPEQIQEWLEAGKVAQAEHLAKLHDDPQWVAMAQQLGAFPGLVKREVLSMPPDERDAWARKQAQETGWLR